MNDMRNATVSPSFSSRKRWTIGVQVAVSLLAVTAMLVMVNYLAARHYRRYQCGADATTQLSPVTLEVLRSVTNKVKVIVFFNRTNPLFDLVTDLLDQYQFQCPQLDVEVVDYERSPTRAKAAETEFNLAPAKEGDRVVFGLDGKRKVRRVVYARDLSEFDYGALLKGKEVKRTGFKGEQLFTSALYSVIDAKIIKVLFLDGHNEHDPDDKDNQAGYLNFARVLQEDQILVGKLDPTALLSGDVPNDCQALVIANPRTAIAPEEVERLEKYLAQGGRLFVLLSNDSVNAKVGLEDLLKRWGVQVGRNFVYESSQGRPGDEAEMVVTHFGNHPIVSALVRSRLELIWPRSIDPLTKSPQAADAPKVVELAMTGPTGVASKGAGRFERQGAVIPLMVAIEKGAIPGINSDRGAARLVVVGDSYFLANKLIDLEANRDFARNAINWLVNRDALVQGINSKPIKEYRISMTTAELTAIRWLFLVVFPGAVLFVGFLVWLRRRA